MKFAIERTSSYGEEEKNPEVEGAINAESWWEIEIKTAEELVELCKKTDAEIIISLGRIARKHSLPTIEIYDDYRE